MFGIGFWELVVIVLVILLVLGPDKLGPIARAVGRAMREMRHGMEEFKDTFGVNEKVREIETLKSEFMDAVKKVDERTDVGIEAEEVDVVRSRPAAARRPPKESDDPEVSWGDDE